MMNSGIMISILILFVWISLDLFSFSIYFYFQYDKSLGVNLLNSPLIIKEKPAVVGCMVKLNYPNINTTWSGTHWDLYCWSFWLQFFSYHLPKTVSLFYVELSSTMVITRFTTKHLERLYLIKTIVFSKNSLFVLCWMVINHCLTF